MLSTVVFARDMLRPVLGRTHVLGIKGALMSTSAAVQLPKSAEKPKPKTKRSSKPKAATKKDKPWEARDANGNLCKCLTNLSASTYGVEADTSLLVPDLLYGAPTAAQEPVRIS